MADWVLGILLVRYLLFQWNAQLSSGKVFAVISCVSESGTAPVQDPNSDKQSKN